MMFALSSVRRVSPTNFKFERGCNASQHRNTSKDLCGAKHSDQPSRKKGAAPLECGTQRIAAGLYLVSTVRSGQPGQKGTNVPYVPIGVAGTRDKLDKAPRGRLSLSRPAVRPADGRPRSRSSFPELRLATLAQPYPTALSALDISEQGVNAQTREINQLGRPRLRKLSRGGCLPGHDLPLE